MNCQEFLNSLDEAVLDRGELSPGVRQHAQQCTQTECRHAWSDFELLDRAVAAWQMHDRLLAESVPPVSPNSTAAAPPTTVAARSVPQQGTRREIPGGWLALTLAGVAVCSLVVVRLGSFPSALRTGGDEIASGKQESEAPAAIAAATPGGSLPEAAEEALVVRELSETYVGWIQNSTGRITDTVAYVLIQEPAEDRVVHPPLWWERLGENLEPLGEGLQRSFRDLLNSAPVEMGNAS